MGDLNIRKVPDNLYDQFKTKAKERGISIPKLLIELIEKEFDDDKDTLIVTICISRVPLKLEKDFKILCARERIDIRDKLVELMEGCLE